MAVAAKKNVTVKQYEARLHLCMANLRRRSICGSYVDLNKKVTSDGLKQSTGARLHDELERQQFQRFLSDRCLYWKQLKGRWCYVLVYVDDLLAVNEDPKMIETLVGRLKKSFQTSEMGGIRYYLEMEVE